MERKTIAGRVTYLKVVVRIGGSVLASPPDSGIMGKYADLLMDLRKKGHELVVVVGGGSLARVFIRIAKELGMEESKQDEIAISVSRLFAKLLSMSLGSFGSTTVPASIDEAINSLRGGKIPVMGGLRPGMTTDAVAAMIAEEMSAELLVKSTDQEGVYTKDPTKYPKAKKIDLLNFDDLFRLLGENKHTAGIHQILDPEAVKILQRKRTRTVIVNGSVPENIILAIKGERVGTTIE